MIALFKRYGGIVGADIAGLYRETDGARQMLEDAARGPLPDGTVSLLLDAGARMDIRDDLLKSTPLGWACRWGHAEVARLLIERGADRMEADAEPWATPRAWAEKMGYPEISQILPIHGGA